MNVDDAVIIAAIQHVTLAHTHTPTHPPFPSLQSKESVAEKKEEVSLTERNKFI